MYKIGDRIIYPGHGVANITEIAEKVVATSTVTFLKLEFVFKDMTILVPFYSIESVGIRYPITKEHLATALELLHEKSEKKSNSMDFTPSGWNRRNKDYQIKMSSGKIEDILCIYRDLMHIAQYKDLSFGERTLLQSAEDLINQEMQVVMDETKESVVALLRNPFKHLPFVTQQLSTPENPT